MDETNNSMEARLEGGMMLRTEGLIKRYGKRTVVNDVSINVRQGEIVGLLGPNGAGKTTSFYMTTGLIIPNAGHIYLDDKDITSFPVYKRARAGIGYLPQEASVFRKLSVEDNILAVLEMTDLTRKQQMEKLESLIKVLEMTDLTRKQQMEKLESLIKEFRLEKVRKNIGDRLSGGERRRTEIARCLAIDPKFIMLDEPFAGVDPIAVEDIQHIVWRLKYRNIGILITDHNVEDTLCITDRAYLLFEGRILFQGSPEELRTRWCARSILPTASCCARRTFSASTRKSAPRKPPRLRTQADACHTGDNHTFCKRRPFTFRKAVFRRVKGRLSACERRPFAKQTATGVTAGDGRCPRICLPTVYRYAF